jgi:hypothetical protein
MEPLRWNGLYRLRESWGWVSLAGYLPEGQRRKRGSEHPCNAATANALQHFQNRGNVAAARPMKTRTDLPPGIFR